MIWIPKFLLHKVEGDIQPTGRGKRKASNYPFYGIVYDDNTPSWTMEQEKAEYWLWTLLILFGILPAVICQLPILRAHIEIWSHAVEGRAYLNHLTENGNETKYTMEYWIFREARGMQKYYPYLKGWSVDEINKILTKKILNK